MAENVQETKPPEPRPKPPEVPKPTEQSNRSEAKYDGRSNESQQSAQQDARDAAQSEFAKATAQRQATADENAQRQPATDENARHQPAFEENAAPRRSTVEEIPQRQQAADHPPKADPATAETATDTGDLTGVGDSSGPWFDEGTNHREGGAVQQLTEGSCVSASGEMLTDGRITQPELLSELGDWSNLSALRDELNNRDGGGTWTGHYFEDGSDALRRASEGPMAAQVQAPFGRAHMVMLEPGENGSFTVRDPYAGSSYDVDSSWVEKYVAGGVFR